MLGQPQGSLQRHFEGAQIAIVDPDDIGAGGDGHLQFALVVHLHQGGHPVARRRFAEIADLALREDRGNQQDGIRAVRRGLQHMRGCDCKIFAQHRDLNRGPSGFEIGQAPLKKALVGEN